MVFGVAENAEALQRRRRMLTPYCYDWLTIHNQEWPTLTIRWGQVISDDPARTSLIQRIYASEQTGTGSNASNRIIIYQAELNKPFVTAAESLMLNEGSRSPYFGRGAVKDVLHTPGEVNKIRECPQHPGVLATHSDTAEVYVWNVERYPSRAEVLAAAQEGGKDGAAAPVPQGPDLVLTGHEEPARFALAWAPGGPPRVASGGEDFFVCVWDLETNLTGITGRYESGYKAPNIPARHRLRGHTATVEDVCFAPGEGEVLASVGDDKMLLVWDLRAGTKPVITVKGAHSSDVQALDWSKLRPELIATGGQDGIVKVWDTRYVSSGGSDKSAKESAAAGGEDAEEGHEEGITRVEWSPHISHLLASGGSDKKALVWAYGGPDAGSDSELRVVFQHIWHEAPVEDLHWNPHLDGQVMLASCSEQGEGEGGGTVQLWRVNDLVWRPKEEAVAMLESYRDFALQGPPELKGIGEKVGAPGGGEDNAEREAKPRVREPAYRQAQQPGKGPDGGPAAAVKREGPAEVAMDVDDL